MLALPAPLTPRENTIKYIEVSRALSQNTEDFLDAVKARDVEAIEQIQVRGRILHSHADSLQAAYRQLSREGACWHCGRPNPTCVCGDANYLKARGF